MNKRTKKMISMFAILAMLTTAAAPAATAATDSRAPLWLIPAQRQLPVMPPAWLTDSMAQDETIVDETLIYDEEELVYDEEERIEDEEDWFVDDEDRSFDEEDILNADTDPEEEIIDPELETDEEIIYQEEELVEDNEERTAENGYAIEEDPALEMLSLANEIRTLEPELIINRLLNRNVAVDTIIELFRYMTEDAPVPDDAEVVLDDQLVESADEEWVSEDESAAYAEAINGMMNDVQSDQYAFVSLLEQLSEVYEHKGNFKNVIHVQKQLLKAEPGRTGAYVKLTNAYSKLGDKSFKLFVNGVQTDLDAPPVVKNGRSLLPFRPISESLEADVKWNAKDQSVIMIRNGQTVKLFIGQPVAFVNNRAVKLDAPAMVQDGRTIVPVRFIGEALQTDVQWQPQAQALIIIDREL